MSDRVTQRAGEGSNQYHATRDIIIQQGVTETRATEIAVAAAQEAVATFTAEAFEVANARTEALVEQVVKRFADAERLDEFADPGFQVIMRRAQIAAAASDRPDDIEVLTELLAARPVADSHRYSKASINRAIEIVDDVDERALHALTLVLSIASRVPLAGSMAEGLAIFDELFRPLVEGVELPSGDEWIEHLDVLGAVRRESLTTLRPINELWVRAHSGPLFGFACEGIPESDSSGSEFISIPDGPSFGLVAHENREGFMRLPFSNATHILHTLTKTGNPEGQSRDWLAYLSDNAGFGKVHDESARVVEAAIRGMPTLARIVNWWESIPRSMSITGVGRALAAASAMRFPGGEWAKGLSL